MKKSETKQLGDCHLHHCEAQVDTCRKLRLETSGLLLALLLLLSSLSVYAKPWRGITPLHNTRSEVERLLGVPDKSLPNASYYRLQDEIAVVWFAGDVCESDLIELNMGWNVPINTVTAIGVIPLSSHKKDEFLDSTQSVKLSDANAQLEYYTDEREGLTVETFKGIVTSLKYEATESESNLKCPHTAEVIVDYRPQFDEYGKLSFADEKLRLENFAKAMNGQLGRGVIQADGESESERRQLVKQMNRAKKYLAENCGIELQRVLIVEGGYSKAPIFRLSLYSIGGGADRLYLSFPDEPIVNTKTRKP